MGTPFGDVVFNFVMRDVLDEIDMGFEEADSLLNIKWSGARALQPDPSLGAVATMLSFSFVDDAVFAILGLAREIVKRSLEIRDT